MRKFKIQYVVYEILYKDVIFEAQHWNDPNYAENTMILEEYNRFDTEEECIEYIESVSYRGKDYTIMKIYVTFKD